MQKGFAKKVLTGILALCMTVTAFGGLSVFAAEENSSANGYIVTFRPGEHGSFTQSYKNGLQALYGNDNYRESSSTGAVAVRVNAGEKLPAAPTINDIEISRDVRERYVVTNPASGYMGGNAQTDLDAVAEYTLRASTEDAMFTVRHLDAETGEEISPALKGTAPVGQNLLFYAVNDVKHYTPKTISQSIILNADESVNTVIFYYTADVNEVTKVEQIPGDIVIQYQDKTVIGGASVEMEKQESEHGQQQSEDAVSIPDEETPKTEFDKGDELIIPDEETPKTQFDDNTQAVGQKMTMVIGGGFLLLILIIVGVVLLNRRNKMVDET